jgi:MarR family transcriptional regulator, organic hydroperoxide resistance regulator
VDELLELALCLKAGQRGMERAMNDALEPVGVTAAQADAITVIGQAEPLSLKSLGDLLIAEAGHPSRLVDRLVQAGWVERSDSADDRRRVVLSLTPEGRRLRKRIEAARQDVLDLARQLLGERDIEPTLRLLQEMLVHTPYKELLDRRRELFEESRPRRPTSRTGIERG